MDYWDQIAGIWDDRPNTDNVEEELAWFRRLTPIQQIIYSTHYLCAEVYNGGFHQYFHNSTGLTAPEAVENFGTLGLHDVAHLVEEAMAVFGTEFPRDRVHRQEFLDAILGDEPAEWNPFLRIDERFYDIIKIPGAPLFQDEDRYTLAVEKFVSGTKTG